MKVKVKAVCFAYVKKYISILGSITSKIFKIFNYGISLLFTISSISSEFENSKAKSLLLLLHRALQNVFHTALLETAICGLLCRYKVEIYLGLYVKFQPSTYYSSLHFLIFFMSPLHHFRHDV